MDDLQVYDYYDYENDTWYLYFNEQLYHIENAKVFESQWVKLPKEFLAKVIFKLEPFNNWNDYVTPRNLINGTIKALEYEPRSSD